MRHQMAERKLGMKSAHRQATLANLASSLVLHNRIATTLPKAKELRRIADRIVTLCKRGTVHARRRANQILRNRAAVHKAFGDFKDRFADRHGGYTRILKLGFRHGDSSPMAMIEYIPSAKMIEKAEAEAAAKKAKKAEKGAKKAGPSLKERLFRKAAPKTLKGGPAEKHMEKKGPPRKAPQQRAKKEA
jgi:large subunit ribosomal protein L17